MRQSPTEKRAKQLSSAVSKISRGVYNKPTPKFSLPSFRETPQVTEVDLMRIKREILDEIGTRTLPDVNEDMVREVIRVMKRLPETERLEVQDIRNAQAFIFGGAKYKTHELMHGGGSASGAITFVNNEIVAGAGTGWTLSQAPISGSLTLFGNGQFLTPGGVDYTLAGTNITTVNPFSAGTVVANYRIL